MASLRLDCVVGTATRLSREKSCALIRSGSVSVNHGVTESVSDTLKEGDVLSVRGFGRYILSSVGDRTKKDRIHIVIKSIYDHCRTATAALFGNMRSAEKEDRL